MRIQICFIVFLFVFSFVHCTNGDGDEDESTKDSALDKKKFKDVPEKKNLLKSRKEIDVDDDEVDETNSGDLSSYADSRYSVFEFKEPTPRTRQRWSQQQGPSFDEPKVNLNEWSRKFLENDDQSSIQPFSFENFQTTNNRPTCSSLIDTKYPLFSDTCGAVPQARYSLPNSFGHRERWQVAQFLHGLISSSNDPTCLRSLKLLLCPMLFPPCSSRTSTPPVLPCQSYCRAVKTRCAIPALEFLPCEILPQTSDICPTTQGYGAKISSNPITQRPQQASWNTGSFQAQGQWPYFGSAASNLPLNLLQFAQQTPQDSTRSNQIDQVLRVQLTDPRQPVRQVQSTTDTRQSVDPRSSTMKFERI